MIKVILAFFYYLPELLALVKIVEKHAESYESKKQLKVKLQAMSTAYETGNADLINSIFHGKLRNETNKDA